MENDNLKSNDTIDLIPLITKAYNQRIFIFRVSIFFILFGFVYSILIPNKYSSYSTFVPQLSSYDKSSSQISGLASLAGISLNDYNPQNNELSPLLYPKIIESVPFRMELLDSEITTDDKIKSIRQFLINDNQVSIISNLKKYTIGLPGLILNKISNKKSFDFSSNNELIYSITAQDEYLFKIIDGLLSIELNEENRFITLSSTHTLKNIPAQITKNAEFILQKKVIELKTKSSSEFLLFSEKQYEIKRKELDDLQDEIGLFKDQNININSALFQNKLDRLLSKASILQSVVQQIASQVQQAKLQVSKDTPIFMVIQPVNTPYNKSGPNRPLIILIWFILGFSLSLFIVFFQGNIKEIRKIFID